LTGAGAEKITKFRLWLRLLMNCKAENYEFVTTKKHLFSSLIQKIVPKVEHVNSVILYQGRKYFFLVVRNLFIVFCLTIHQEPEPEPELEPEPTLSIFFGSGSGSSQKGRLRAAPAPTPAPQLCHQMTFK